VVAERVLVLVEKDEEVAGRRWVVVDKARKHKMSATLLQRL